MPPPAPPPTKRPPKPPRGVSAPKSQPAGPVVTPTLQMRSGVFQPPRVVLNAVEGWGKTSCGAYAPKPAVIMARGETGYDTLLGVGRVPYVDATVVETWPALLALLDELLLQEKLPYETLVFDALGGIERLCHEEVCRRDFKGLWDDKGFLAYHKGYDVAVTDWIQFLARLEKLSGKGLAILLLGHTLVKPHRNPEGEDFDRYVCSVHPKTWNSTHQWADAVLFGSFLQVVDDSGTRKRGIGGYDRIINCTRRDLFDAKNRYGMPDEIEIPDDPAVIWSTIYGHIRQEA